MSTFLSLLCANSWRSTLKQASSPFVTGPRKFIKPVTSLRWTWLLPPQSFHSCCVNGTKYFAKSKRAQLLYRKPGNTNVHRNTDNKPCNSSTLSSPPPSASSTSKSPTLPDASMLASHTHRHKHTCTQTERERERERGKKKNILQREEHKRGSQQQAARKFAHKIDSCGPRPAHGRSRHLETRRQTPPSRRSGLQPDTRLLNSYIVVKRLACPPPLPLHPPPPRHGIAVGPGLRAKALKPQASPKPKLRRPEP